MKKSIIFILSFTFFIFSFSTDYNLTGWKLKQYNSSVTYTFGNITVPGGYYVIICRGAKKANFEAYYGVTLSSNVIFIDSTGNMPTLNGAELFSLYDNLNNKIDTTFMSLVAGNIYYRDSTNVNTFSSVSFSITYATPGSTGSTVINKGRGMVITEVVDAANYLYEYIELYNDTGGFVNPKPTITNVGTSPAIPFENDSVIVSSNITDDGSITADTIFYQLNGGSWVKKTHDNLSGTLYSYKIGRFSANDSVKYFIKATDNLNDITISDTFKFIVKQKVSQSFNLNGWKLYQYNSSYTYNFGDTLVPGGYYVIICRGAKKAAFETYYGLTLPSNVIFIDSSYNMPSLNGSETFSLYDNLNNKVDTTFMSLTTGRVYYRDSTNANTFSSTTFSTTAATPGSTNPSVINKGRGMVITEVVDAANYLYEYIELYNDTVGASNTVITSVNRNPLIPYENQQDTVWAVIKHEVPLKSVKIIASSYDSSVIDTYNMSNISGDTLFRYVINGRGDGCRFECYVEVVDSLDRVVQSSPERFFWGITPMPKYKENDNLGKPRYLGYLTRTTGIVTVGTGAFTTTQNIINLQQNYILGAVWKNDSIKSDGSETVVPSDSVVVEGTITFYNGQTRIGNPYSKLTKFTTGHYIDTILLTADQLKDTVGDKYEGLLLKINTARKVSGTWPTPGSSGLIVCKDTTLTKNGTKAVDTFLVWIDSDTDIDDSPEPTWPKQIVGILTQYDTSEPYWSMYEVYPRSINDMNSAIGINESSISATLQKDGVLLRWSFTDVENTSLIRVERKKDDEKFYSIVGELKPDQRTFKDTDIDNKRREYKVIGITKNGKVFEIGTITIVPKSMIKEFNILTNNNLAKDKIDFELALPSKGNIDLGLYNSSGALVKNIFSGIIEKGYAKFFVDIKDLPSGVYFIKEKNNNKSLKLNIVK
uniref:T9SS type A sorting domain-containing protein n=1 Tax=candidate division WOR-3 bacterium TaxID=2052148 RepID=A0A7C3J6Z3_UNCW3